MIDLAHEEWRPIPGYEGWIDASNMGRARRWYAPRRWPRMEEPSLVEITTSSSGYCSFAARTAYQRGCRMPQHVAVLLAFAGPRPPAAVACHFPDPTRANCCFDNLRWDTLGQNHVDAKIHHSGMASRVLARLALLRKSFPHLRSDVDGLAFEARPNIYANNGLHMKLRARARREALARGAA